MIVGFWACKPCKSGAGRNYSASVKGEEFTQNRCGGGACALLNSRGVPLQSKHRAGFV